MQQEHPFLNTGARSFLVPFLVGGNGIQGVVLGEVDVTDGIINLIEILFVLVGGSHALQTLDHLLVMGAGHHLGHGDTGIELQFVGRTLADDVLECLIGFLVMSQGSL